MSSVKIALKMCNKQWNTEEKLDSCRLQKIVKNIVEVEISYMLHLIVQLKRVQSASVKNVQ
jgi:hypothetical protein